MKNYHNNPLPPLKFDKNRFRVKQCPCGRSNKDGKFSPYEGYDDKGYCHSCSVKFLPDLPKSYESYNTYTQRTHYKPKLTMHKPTSFIETDIFKKSLENHKDNYGMEYLFMLFNKHGEGVKIMQQLMKTYFIGTSDYWQGSTVFWQIDINGKIRTGKIMLYNSNTGKRVKEPFDHFQWIHCMLKLPEFNLTQCCFGEHLLKIDRTRHIAIVESEKTAIIASIYFPQFIWLATGGVAGLTAEKCKALQGRHVILFPDISKPISDRPTAFERWSEKAVEFSSLFLNTTFTVSDLLERRANEEERKEGLDLADYLVKFDYKQFTNVRSIETETSFNTTHTKPITTIIATEVKEDFSSENNIALDDISQPCAITTKLTEQFNHFEIVTMQLSNGKYLDCLFDSNGEPIKPNAYTSIVEHIEKFFNKKFVPAVIDEQHCLINWYSEPPKTDLAVMRKSIVTNQKDDVYKKEPTSTIAYTNNIGYKASTNTKDWTKDIEELEQYFSSITLPTAPIGLSQGMTIIDIAAFIQSHLATVKANNGKQTFLPYLDRLKGLKRYLMSSFKELLV